MAEKAGHLVQRRAGVEQLRSDGMAPGVRRYFLRDVRLVGLGAHDAPGLRDAQLSVFLRCGDEILVGAVMIGACRQPPMRAKSARICIRVTTSLMLKAEEDQQSKIQDGISYEKDRCIGTGTFAENRPQR